MDACSLFELKQKGCFYSWKHVYSRIDQVLVNTEWLDVFTEGEATFLPHGVSDHLLVVISFYLEFQMGPKPFRYFYMWSLHSKFLKSIR